MIEYIPIQTEIPDAEGYSVCAVGLGGAGANALDRLALDGTGEAELICMNADVRALSNSLAPTKIQLGKSLTQGLGAGGDPELGLEAARSSENEIRSAVAGRDIVFLCVGLGGGTGSGAAPLVARIAKESGAFVVVFAIMPFTFEGRRRRAQADAALAELSSIASALVTFENSRMGELVLPKEGIQGAFAAADEVIGQSVRAVTSIILRPGLIRIGMDDLITALRNIDSRCLFGYGQAKGENRAQEALSRALKSPLLEKGALLNNAKNVLVHVAGGKTMTLFEIELLMTELEKHVSDDAQILFGSAVDNSLGTDLAVTIISSLGKQEEETGSATVESRDRRPDRAAATDDAVSAAEDPAGQEAMAAASAPAGESLTAEKERVTAKDLLELADEDSPGEEVPVAQVDAPEEAMEIETVPADTDPEHLDRPDADGGETEEVRSAANEAPAEVVPEETEEEAPAVAARDEEEPEYRPEPEPEPVAAVEANAEEKEDKVIRLDPSVRSVRSEPEEMVGHGPHGLHGLHDRVEAEDEGFAHLAGEEFRPFEPDRDEEREEDESFQVSAIPGFEDVQDGPTPGRAAEHEAEHESELPPRGHQPASGGKSRSQGQDQGLLELDPAGARGRFEKSSRTIINGEDLDVPTFLRKRGR
ncbi:hypothetical protein BH23VER1_BH23VER1_31780 [soil metagenome]